MGARACERRRDRSGGRGRARGRNRPDLVIAARAARPQNGRRDPPVVFVVYPGITALDLVGPHEVFGAAGRATTSRSRATPHGRVAVVTTPRARRSSPTASLASVRGPIDTLVVVGGEGRVRGRRAIRRSCAAVATLRARAAGGSRRCAPARSCSPRPGCSTAGARRRTGARATARARASRRSTVEPDPIFVRDGNVWTSAGVTAGMDLALALVEDDLGRDVALRRRAPARDVRAAPGRPVAVQRAARRAARRARPAARAAERGSPSTPTRTSRVERSRRASR